MNKKNKKIKITKDYIQKAAYRYLERYATTEANLKFILNRKIDRQLVNSDNPEDLRREARIWVLDTIKKCVALGLVNDQLYGEAKINSYLNSGNSLNIAKKKLKSKGLSTQLISEMITDIEEKTPEINFISAIKYAKKRRFGPFRIRKAKEDTERKEQASMARAGFLYEEIIRVLKADSEELENILYENK
ncbi:MAG: RecX family transcriptional regulator [Alphaproteobacteria bacterium]|nr:RecX family transcriptional regulator [Alphaproteobacteria bacterium]HPF46633.1 RecX family transcriptional regulator [Emcibacteraceae bacterium]HRW29620.1 RecX family transcriptional regulator [Emcibacteraceae bacterium]